MCEWLKTREQRNDMKQISSLKETTNDENRWQNETKQVSLTIEYSALNETTKEAKTISYC